MSADGSRAGQDQKGKLLRGRLDVYKRTSAILLSESEAMVKAQADAAVRCEQFGARLRDVAAGEPEPYTQHVLLQLSEAVHRVEQHRASAVCERLRHRAVRPLRETQKTIAKPVKALLDDRDATIRAMRGLRQKRVVATRKKNRPQVAQITAKLGDERHRLHHINDTVNDVMAQFEAARVQDLRSVLDEYVRGQIYYHCRALELLGPMCELLKAIDPMANVEAVRSMVAEHSTDFLAEPDDLQLAAEAEAEAAAAAAAGL